MNVLVRSELDPTQLADLADLLTRCEEADGHPALADPQRAAAARADLGAHGAHVVLAYDGPSLIGCAFVTPALDGATALHVAVDPDHRHDGTHTQAALLEEALRQAGRASKAGSSGAGEVRLWIMQATESDDAMAATLGFSAERDLLQMRVPLPLPTEVVANARPVATRAFRPGVDDDTWLTINNLAFADHPEQGGWTLEELHAHMAVDWFDPEGFLMADSPDGDGLIGSCWTKMHRTTDPMLGEIYVISVDPARHGQGWGKALTVAGLQWLTAHGAPVGMLYTTSSNTPAVALYRSLGFKVDHVDRSYMRSI
jgi:mycothiol synthase